MKGKIFTPLEATRMLPLVGSVVANIKAASRLLDRHEKAIAEITAVRLAANTTEQIDAAERAAAVETEKIEKLHEHLRTLESELSDLGWFIADAREGVAKCYSERDTRIVYLTWTIGEDEVRHWFPLKKTHHDRLPLSEDEKIADTK